MTWPELIIYIILQTGSEADILFNVINQESHVFDKSIQGYYYTSFKINLALLEIISRILLKISVDPNQPQKHNNNK